MLTPADRSRIAINIWTARIIPLMLAGIVGYATYVLVALCCVNYLLVKHNDGSAAAPILVIYFLLFILMTACFLRLVYIITVDPPYVPLGAAALRDRRNDNRRRTTKSQHEDIAMGEYNSGSNSGGTSAEAMDSYNDPDSPGLELFYTKDVFICSTDGRPIWCSECSNWKPDRTHHDSSSGRCVRKMDHFCPWVGGPVGENNLKFFIQFNGYTALYCFHLLVVMAYYIREQVITEGEHVNRQFIAILALASFFGLFTGSMAGTSLNLAALNLTQVERLGGRTKLYILAILKSSSEKPSSITHLGEITYPLEIGFKQESHATNRGSNIRANGTSQFAQDMGNAAQTESYLEQRDHSTAGSIQKVLERQSSDRSPQPPRLLQEHAVSDTVLRRHPVLTQERGSQAGKEQSADSSTGTQVLIQNTPPTAERGTPRSTTLSKEPERPEETISGRDSRATRTFAVLKMLQPGDNPWDLGSARLNLETVMGTGILQWLLPIRRSPCCDHEDGESQFKIGPKVALLRAAMNPDQPVK